MVADESANHPAPAPALAYRVPGDDPPPATAGDVLQGAVAAAVLVMVLIRFGGLVFLPFHRDRFGGDRWDAADWSLYLTITLLMGLGVLASLRSVRHYLTGRHRRRAAALRDLRS